MRFKSDLKNSTAISGVRGAPSHNQYRTSGRFSTRPASTQIASPALGMDERGLVLFPPARLTANGVSRPEDMDRRLLRFALLFWDHIDIPKNNFIDVYPGPEVDYLQSIGIVSRSRVMVSSSAAPEILIETHRAAFHALDPKDPGKWSLARVADADLFGPGYLHHDRGLLVELFEAIPVPDQDVTFEDLLRFKEDRRAELLALRYHLSGIYQEILNSEDKPLAKQEALARLDSALATSSRSVMSPS